MADLVLVDVEQRAAQLVEAHARELAEVVRLAVDRKLEQLVDQELAARNGAQKTFQRSNGASKSFARAEQRRCRHCGETKPLDQFGQHRHVCHDCRRQQQARARERRAQPAQEGDSPRPDGASTYRSTA